MVKWDDLIGVPFAYGGRGPKSYDCYGLVRELHSREGVVLPDYASPTDGPSITAAMTGELRLWSACDQAEGAVVLIRVLDKRGCPNLHCGQMIDGNRMMHTWEDSGGVVVERLDQWKRRILGFYKYAG